MKKLSFIVMACLTVLGLTQCKKNELPNNTDDGNRLNITLTLDNGGQKELPEIDNDGQKVHPVEENGLAKIVYDNNDVVYVGSNGKYMGYLTYNGSLFAGSINAAATGGQPLQCIFMGGRTIEGLNENISTECTFSISDQSQSLAVISCAASNEEFHSNNLSYTAYLRNKCALVKFGLGEMSTDATITLTGMKTEATIGFDGTVTSGTATGNIVTNGTGTTRYAVVLSDQTVVSDGTILVAGNVGTFSIPTAPYTNAFLTNATMTFGTYATPFTLEALTEGTIQVANPQSGMKYAINGGAKNAVTSSSIPVSVGDRVAFYGDGTTITSYSNAEILTGTRITGTAEVNAYGNIMSLVDETGYATNTTLVSSYSFAGLFYGNTKLKNASGLLLPATTLTPYCDLAMFLGCANLTAAPALPAETLSNAEGCYGSMFNGCTSLTATPALNATTLAQSCYANMFQGCTGLTTAPTLPAETLAQGCYQSMFQGCTGLTNVPANLLPATTLAQSCYESMFQDCTGLQSTPELPATTLTQSCYKSMFSGCSSLSSVTCLATNISASNCTDNWLYNAGSNVTNTGKSFYTPGNTLWETSVSSIPAGWIRLNPDGSFWDEPVTLNTPLTLLALTQGTIKVINPKSGMKYSVSGGAMENVTTADIEVFAGDRVRFYGNTPTFNINGNLTRFSGGTAEVKAYGNIMSLLNETDYANQNELQNSTNLEQGVFHGLFMDYSGDNSTLIDASQLLLPATTLGSDCYKSMFSNCKKITAAPALPAITMAKNCYNSMFQSCSSLTTAPMISATELAENCFMSMFQSCTSLTTPPTLSATTLTKNCYNDMFGGCDNLTSAPALPATTLVTGCYNSMFTGCKNLTSAPALPAQELAEGCYANMFQGCKKLSSITCLATSGINENGSTTDWMNSAGSEAEGTKTFTKVHDVSWPSGDSGIPSGWNVVEQ